MFFFILTLYENQVLGSGSHNSVEGAACGRLRFALAPPSKQYQRGKDGKVSVYFFSGYFIDIQIDRNILKDEYMLAKGYCTVKTSLDKRELYAESKLYDEFFLSGWQQLH
jgi:hypothetical protein